MKSKGTVWISLFILLAFVSFSCAKSTFASEEDEKAVMNAVAQFYAALNTMFTGNVDPMKEVWSHADDVTYMGPGGGFQVGWDKVLENWEAQAAMKLGGKVEAADMRITVGQDIAVTNNYEKGENTNARGEVQKVSIRATNVFRKEDGKWKMIGHHTDLLPYLEK
jgi:ketosteroid isomerase-like protein